MANPEHLTLLKQGTESWNRWRKQHPKPRPDLSGANLSGTNLSEAYLSNAYLSNAYLTEADLTEANLTRARLTETDLTRARLTEADLTRADLTRARLIRVDFTKADLTGADLSRAIFKETDLTEADLTEARLTRADLTEANLTRARLTEADLSNANLSRAIFKEAVIGWTIFSNVDLRIVQGLKTVNHRGPSTIGTDTLVRSEGDIPEVFLRGAGLPDTFITYARSLVSHPIQYYTCFISHSSKDQRFCNRLYADLQAKGVRAWYFPEDATWGKSVWGEIDRSIKLYDKLVVVCSEHSLQSGPVQREIERALQREDREGKHILFPIRIDNYLFEVWEFERKADVLSKVVGDFRGWNNSAAKYDAAFQKFLKALNAQEDAIT